MSGKSETKTSSEPSAIIKLYLILYNVISAVGWTVILIKTFQSIAEFKTTNDAFKSKNLYKNVGWWLKIFQTLAYLEVLHAVLKFVRSNAFLTFLQLNSRVFLVWAVVNVFPTSKDCFGLLLICVAWSITEVIRYSYYALNLVGFVPSILTWLRYSLFIVLYPMGVAGEITCIIYAIIMVYPTKIRNEYSFLMPNKWNFSYDIFYVLIFTVLIYVPGFPKLYKHMLAQRQKVLYPEKQKKN